MKDQNATTAPALTPTQQLAQDRRRAELKAKTDELARQQAELVQAQAELDEAPEPADERTLCVNARDAILDLLAHKVDTSAAGQPERNAWESIAAVFDRMAGPEPEHDD